MPANIRNFLGGFYMNYGDYIRLIRKNKGLKQYNLLPDKNKSKGAKVEKNNVVFTIDLLKKICRNIGVTFEEFIYMTEADSPEEELYHQYKFCIKYLDRQPEKEEFITKFSELYKKNSDELTMNQVRLLFAIRCTLGMYWNEIPKVSTKEINDMYQTLIKQDFFSQYDYMVLCNAATLFTLPQLKKLVKKTFPIYLNQKRNAMTKVYAKMFMMNVACMNIYKKEYKDALYYAELLERHSEKYSDYYTQVNILYIKNTALGFLEDNPRYFTKAYDSIEIMKSIGDTNASMHLEKELTNLIRDPNFYDTNTSIEYVKVDNFD